MVACILRQSKATSDVEALYILRSVRDNDPWSGHVAFPGGRQTHGESDVQTAIREAKEEIGIDLTNESLYTPLGRISDRSIYLNGRRTLVVGCFVFQTKDCGEPITRDPREVEAFTWVPLTYIQDQRRIEPFELKLSRGLRSPVVPWLQRWLQLIGIDNILFPSILLPGEPSEKDFRLWGLTLNLTENILGIRPLKLQHPIRMLRAVGVGQRFKAGHGFHDILWSMMALVLGRVREDIHFSQLYRMYIAWLHFILLGISYIIVKKVHPGSFVSKLYFLFLLGICSLPILVSLVCPIF
jgi:8-oxo-dGTP pyrophosphatase MutT (NUDIX family)